MFIVFWCSYVIEFGLKRCDKRFLGWNDVFRYILGKGWGGRVMWIDDMGMIGSKCDV